MERTIKSSDFFRMLNMLYAVQVISLVGFSVVIFYLNQAHIDSSLPKIAHYALTLFIIAALAASQFIPQRQLKKIDPKLDLRHKVPKYFPVAIIRVACLEASGLAACIAAFVTGQQYFLLIVPLLLIVLFFYRPTKTLIADELSLSLPERNLLDNPNITFVQGKK